MIERGKPTKSGLVQLTFTVPVEDVPGPVSVVGDFNGWDPYAHPMPVENGVHQVRIAVGAHEPVCFRYLAEGGVWFDDADADYHDERGGHLRAAIASGPDAANGRAAAPAAGRQAKAESAR